MGFQISQLGKAAKHVFFAPDKDTPDEGINVTYNPQRYTVALEDKLEEIAGRSFQSVSYILMLTGWHPGDKGFEEDDEEVDGLLVEWDLMDGDQPVPIRADSLKQLPLEFVSALLEAIKADNNPSSEEGKRSGGGSLAGV